MTLAYTCPSCGSEQTAEKRGDTRCSRCGREVRIVKPKVRK